MSVNVRALKMGDPLWWRTVDGCIHRGTFVCVPVTAPSNVRVLEDRAGRSPLVVEVPHSLPMYWDSDRA